MNNEIDPFEEFEFKPITDGLGFHRNQKPLAEKSPKPVDKITSFAKESFQENLFSTPLPTKKSNFSNTSLHSSGDGMNQTHDIVDEILKNIETSKQKATLQKTPLQLDMSASDARIITSRMESIFKPSGPLMTAIILDLMLVMASTLLFLVALLAITKIDLLQNIKNPDDQGSVYLSLFLLFSSVSFIYYVVFRSFLGYTPGEWAYDQKIQVRGDRVDFFILTKIALRSILIFVTGGVLIPLISWVFGRDFLGEFLDLPLVRKK